MNARMEDHISGGRWILVVIPENAYDICADLARRHGPKLGMKTLDTLQVACALELKAKRFWTFDKRQAKLAKAQGLKTS
ncbi:MAG TPA: PIN domain-containing protein [Candidatus Eremiobacteraceae bacterium]|nr:PIN domain-containing protein [Candidatus Eremiobacteraceae bacterium]